MYKRQGEDYTGEENAGSVVLQLSCGACRALLTGDLEGSGEEEVLGAAERCQILKVAHHGSRNSTSEAFLNRIQPQILSLIHIFAYREANGPFGSVEEIMNIEGIKEKMFEKIRGSIEV